MAKIFTYGTLLRGRHNHYVMEQARGKFIGQAKIKNKDLYFAFSRNSFPAMVEGKGVVYGEVFEVDEKGVEILDRLEGYMKKDEKNSMYLRRKAKVTLKNGEEVWVSYYLWNRRIYPELKIEDGRFP